jgi:hypothetical protein
LAEGVVEQKQGAHPIGLAPGVPHLANLPLASLHRFGAAGFLSGHLVNLPLASRHWFAAIAGLTAIKLSEVKAIIHLRIASSRES